LWGGRGDDYLLGGDLGSSAASTDPNVLRGGPGRDEIVGDLGPDEIYGGTGRDDLSGHMGDDHLDGGPQWDHGNGWEGRDTCVNIEVVDSCR
jgi:Ca2+-binding RTX toxin-like protein